jgi:hypothetical protein
MGCIPHRLTWLGDDGFMQLLAHPFALLPDGTAATVTDGTDDAFAQDITVIISTMKGERDLVPTFGLTDPTFDELDAAELNATLAVFCSAVAVADMTTTAITETTSAVTVHWEERPSGD